MSGNAVRGIEILNQVLRNNPRDPYRSTVLSNLSLAFFQAKDYVKGLTWGMTCISESPNLAATQMILAMNYGGLGEIEKAKTALEAARRLAPGLIESRLEGDTSFRNPNDQNRQKVFLRIAAGLEDPSAADALR